jgi:hypothetical protein
MPDSTSVLRARAREHERELEAKAQWLSVQDLMARWGVSYTTVTSIARDKLPFLDLGRGSHVLRRYDPKDVEEYERRSKRGSAA